MPDSPAQVFWLRRASALRLYSRLAWSLQYFLQVWPWLCAVLAACLLLLRSTTNEHEVLFWAIAAFSIALFAAGALLRALRRTLTEADALVLLEDRLGLQSRLSAAQAGVCTWPAQIAIPRILHIRRDAFLFRALFGPLFLALAALVPVEQPVLPASADSVEAPLPITEVEVLLEKLGSAGVVDPESLDSFEARLDEFKQRAQESWYEHEALEAADSLHQELEAALADLAGNGQQLASALERLAEGGLNQSELEALAQTAQELLERLESGTVKLDQKLAQQLARLAEDLATSPAGRQGASTPNSQPGAGGQNAAPQLGRIPLTQELREKLRQLDRERAHDAQGRGAEQRQAGQEGSSQQAQGERQPSGSCAGGASEGPMCSAESRSKGGSGQSDAQGASNAGQEPGGVGRGPGAAPLNLMEKSPQLTSNRVERTPAQEPQADLEPGEMLGLEARAPQVDPQEQPASQSDAIASSQIQGRNAAWQDEFTPQEQELLGRFYK